MCCPSTFDNVTLSLSKGLLSEWWYSIKFQLEGEAPTALKLFFVPQTARQEPRPPKTCQPTILSRIAEIAQPAYNCVVGMD